MNKDQIQFLVSGILFGFLVGFLIAYAVYEPRVVQQAAPVPAAGNMGMSGAGAAPVEADAAAPGTTALDGKPPFVIPCVWRRPRVSVVTSRSHVFVDRSRSA